MAAVGLAPQVVEKIMNEESAEGSIRIGCLNGPDSVTITGDANEVERLVQYFQEQNVFARLLRTGDKAYHSHHMALVGAKYESLLAPILLHPKHETVHLNPRTLMISSMSGSAVEPDETTQASYWRSNLERPVKFSSACRTLMERETFRYLEIGPHSALEMILKQNFADIKTSNDCMEYRSTLVKERDSAATVMSLAGSLFTGEYAVNLLSVNGVPRSPRSPENILRKTRLLSTLPAYPWQHGAPNWHESRISKELRQRRYPRHDLLGAEIPGLNGYSRSWRIILSTKHVSWLMDHKLGQTIVLPAAAYLSMAIQALLQIENEPKDTHQVRLRNVKIVEALMLPLDDHSVEIFTEFEPFNVSSTISVRHEWRFRISSFVERKATIHANGLIALCNETTQDELPECVRNMEPQSVTSWYERFHAVGLKFGSCFQTLRSISCLNSRETRQCMSTCSLQTESAAGLQMESPYLVHPVTLDALIQTAIIASTSGNISRLEARVPTSFEEISINLNIQSAKYGDGLIFSQAARMGFEAYTINSTLFNTDRAPIASMKKIEVVGYPGAKSVHEAQERNLIFRVQWKPDFTRPAEGKNLLVANYMEYYVRRIPEHSLDKLLIYLAAALDLMVHARPRMRILSVSNESEDLVEPLQYFLRSSASFRRCANYVQAVVNEKGDWLAADGFTGEPRRLNLTATSEQSHKFDLIILAPSMKKLSFDELRPLVAPEIFVLAAGRPDSLFHASFDELKLVASIKNDRGTIAAWHSIPSGDSQERNLRRNILLVFDTEVQSSMVRDFQRHLEQHLKCKVRSVMLEDLKSDDIPTGVIVISFVELHRPLLMKMTECEMSKLKLITDNVSLTSWLNGINSISALPCHHALAFGLARTLRVENPSLVFVPVGIDLRLGFRAHATAYNITSLIREKSRHYSERGDYEFFQVDDSLYVSRYVPDGAKNAYFREKLDSAQSHKRRLGRNAHVELALEQVGQLDGIYFQQRLSWVSPLDATEVEVHVSAFGLNAKDLYALLGRVNTLEAACNTDFVGTVIAVGPRVSDINFGDRIIAMAPGPMSTKRRVPSWSCAKLLGDEDEVTLATMPLVHATALYALQDRAKLQAGERVLIHSGAGGLGIAAIQIAQMLEATVYTTVSTDNKRDFLVEHLGVPPEQIFNSRDSTFFPQILQRTNGEGVDVVLNSLTGSLLHESWKCCAEFGRFVEVGKREIASFGSLDMRSFSNSTTFTAFDMADMYHSTRPQQHQTWSR